MSATIIAFPHSEQRAPSQADEAAPARSPAGTACDFWGARRTALEDDGATAADGLKRLVEIALRAGGAIGAAAAGELLRSHNILIGTAARA
jgi:hypothetical protein